MLCLICLSEFIFLCCFAEFSRLKNCTFNGNGSEHVSVYVLQSLWLFCNPSENLRLSPNEQHINECTVKLVTFSTDIFPRKIIEGRGLLFLDTAYSQQSAIAQQLSPPSPTFIHCNLDFPLSFLFLLCNFS